MTQVKSIAVVGGGTMGAGIAQLAAAKGCSVELIDVNADVLTRSLEAIKKRLDRSVEKKRITADQRDVIFGRITPHDSIKNLGDVELAIEAVVEDLDVKHKVFTALAEATPPSAVLATNTSSLSIGKIAEAVGDPSRVVGMHFFNPAPIMPLVEVIAGERSAPASVELAFDAALDWGKVPVRVKDTPGFIVNRVARGFYLEALRLLGEGVCGVDEVDAIMRNHANFKMGPFELMDLIGIDVNLAVSGSVWEQFGRHARFTPHPIQKELVDAGYFGRKAGRGFYAHDGGTPIPAYPVDRRSFEMSPLLTDAAVAFCNRAGAVDANHTERYVLCRILGAIINEAGSAFSAGVATSSDIDTAMIKGTNYPKGPLAWADEIGHRTVRGLLKTLNAGVEDDRFKPSALFAKAE